MSRDGRTGGENHPERSRLRSYQLIFAALRPGSPLAFPCDARGLVALDSLSARAKIDYLYARALVGRDFDGPQVVVMESPEQAAADVS